MSDSVPETNPNDATWIERLKLSFKTAINPLGPYAATERKALEDARCERNFRRMQLITPFTLVVHGLTQYRIRHAVGISAAEELWRHGFLRLQSMALLFSLWNVCMIFGPNWRWVRRYRLVIGDVSWLFYAALGAALSVNAQQFQGGFSAYFALMLLGSSLFQVRGRLAVLGTLIAGIIFTVGVTYMQPAPAVRTSLYFIAIEVSVISLVVSRFGLATMAREIAARLRAESVSAELDQLNRELERRVEAQVAELKARAEELDAMNKRLDAEVRDRSRELSAALERIGGGIPTETLAPNSLIGDRFQIQRVLGSGGIGTVYFALDTATNLPVAVKVLNPGLSHNLEDLKRFLREGEVLASVNHPAIVRTIHVGITSVGRAFLALEYVEGVNLQSHLSSRGKLSSSDGASVGAIIAEAIAAAHHGGLVHRDIKPSNVMLSTSGVGVKVLDFGLAKAVGAAGPEYTLTGESLGTPAFMAPEQFIDFRSVDGQADVYALGMLLFVATTGQKPYDAATPHEWMMAHSMKAPRNARTVDPNFDEPLAALIDRCLEKVPSSRPTAAEVATQLHAIADRLKARSALDVARAAMEVFIATTVDDVHRYTEAP